MKNLIFGLSILLALSGFAAAQTASSKASTAASSAAAVTKNGNNASIAAGTQIATELQSSLSAENAKVGDKVVLKTKQAIKQNGLVVVEKGSKLVGHVTEVQKKAKDSAGSKVSVLFDTLQQKGSTSPISATIVSITKVSSALSAADDSANTDFSGSTSTRTTSSSSSGGGLLGGVGNTVGGVANTATSNVGNVANTAVGTVGSVAQTAGSTTRAIGSNIAGLQISQSADASANGSSTLSLNRGNLKLEKGTTFNLALSESANVGAEKPGN